MDKLSEAKSSESVRENLLKTILTATQLGSAEDAQKVQDFMAEMMQRLAKGCPFQDLNLVDMNIYCKIHPKEEVMFQGKYISYYTISCKYRGKEWECPIMKMIWGLKD